jgi:hypothetical protein
MSNPLRPDLMVRADRVMLIGRILARAPFASRRIRETKATNFLAALYFAAIGAFRLQDMNNA